MTQPSLLPLPPSVAAVLLAPGTSHSLVFDRGFDQWTRSWSRVEAVSKKGETIIVEGRQHFLGAFGNDFCTRPPADYEARLDRRRQVLDQLGARTVAARTAAPLVIGLGLSHPTETGLLLDRLTGTPYLPATSIKGLLRAAARWVAQDELAAPAEDDAAFWADHRDRLFGPALLAGVTAAKGELILYDAFPERWPRLELDILTPHYPPDASNGGPPGDWHDPTPVPFLTVAAETPFLFAFGARKPTTRADDLERVERLLRVALHQLGLGGKTAAGYGLFHPGRTAGPGSAGAPGSGPVVWPGAELTWEPGSSLLQANYRGQSARQQRDAAHALLDQLSGDDRQRLTGKVPGEKKRKKRKPLPCDVEVVQHSDEWFELVAVRPPKAGS